MQLAKVVEAWVVTLCRAALRRGHRLAASAAVAGMLLAGPAFAGQAVAAPTPPFTQCPPVGFDRGCAVLIVIEADGSKVALSDHAQQPFDGLEDTLVGVQNNSAQSVSSLALSGTNLFGFDEDGLCSEFTSPRPAGCPFGATGYEGPNTSFTIPSPDEGTVNFLEDGIAAGASAYFSVEGAVTFTCESESCKVRPLEATTLSTSLSGGGQSGEQITVPTGTGVTDTATLSGANAAKATGTVTYSVYSDAECKTLVASAGTVTVAGASVPASEEETLTAPGSYYWKASYSGDEANQPSESACGAELVTVEQAQCSTVAGEGRFGEGPELQRVRNVLSTNLAARQRFHFYWNRGKRRFRLAELERAVCSVRRHVRTFHGAGEGTLDGVGEYLVNFTIRINSEEQVTLIVRIAKEGSKEALAYFKDEGLEESSEAIA